MSTPTRSSSFLAKRHAPAFGVLPRLYRLALVIGAAWLIHAASVRPLPPDEVSLADASTFFPTAARFGPGDRRLGGQTVIDAQGQSLGLVLTTSPHTDDIVGYAGPSNLLIALDTQQRVIGVRLLASGDTKAHVEQVKASGSFWRQFMGLRRDHVLSRADAVSGSTLTSLAMAEAIERRLGGAVTSLRFPEPVTLAEVQALFPNAAAFNADDPRPGWQRVLGKQSQLLGFAVRTSPATDNGRGYQGPTESLVAIAPDGQTVAGLILRRSYDTPEYVERVKDDNEFLRLLSGRTIDQWAKIDFRAAGIEGVSGATQTSFAVADGLKRRFAADVAARQAAPRSPAWNVGLIAIVCGALAMTFSPLRASRRARFVWQGVLMAVFLFWLGDLLSLALLAGWARHGVPWQASPSVVLLAAVAFIVPWTTRRQVYCQSICPHGAAQSWLGRYKRMHIRISPRWQRWLAPARPALLAAGVLLAVSAISFDLAWLEPFDGWVLKSAAAVSATIAIAGLVASLFIPQAYCRYACPTGELLHLVKSGGGHDRIGGRDWWAGAFLVVAAAALFLPRQLAFSGSEPASSATSITELTGQAFGTTWSVKLRGEHDTRALRESIAAELERIESTLSHWRPDSFTAQFNATETTLALEYPAELVALVAQAQEISRLTDGAYDITVAPLVDAWGFGPAGEKQSPPSDEEISRLLARSGWQKLTVDTEENTLRKSHPQLAIDLGSLLQGYAADRVAKILDNAQVSEFLIEVGGELIAQGSWQVAIEDPREPARTLMRLTLNSGGLATSGFYRATRSLEGLPAHHLISPQTGRPIAATAILATVRAASAVEADGWATALLALGLPKGLQVAEQEGLRAILLDTGGQAHATKLNIESGSSVKSKN